MAAPKKPVLLPLEDFWPLVNSDPQATRLLGLDLGSKTIGTAIADSGNSVASPLHLIERSKFTKDRLALEALVETYKITGFIFGWPLNMDGTEGPRCQATRDFARNLQNNGLKLPMTGWDERMSSQAVERFLIQEQDMTRGRRAQVVDKMAAAYILQATLDAKHQFV